MDIRNGSRKYLKQLKNYLRGKKKKKRNWTIEEWSVSVVIAFIIYLHYREKILTCLSHLQTNLYRAFLP